MAAFDRYGETVRLKPHWVAQLAIVALVLGMLGLYWKGILSLFSAWQRPEYSHGYIIPVIALIIALKRYSEPSADAAPPIIWPGVLAIGLAVIVGIFGGLVGISDIVTYGLLLSIVAVAMLVLGPLAALRMWPAYIYLSFMLPLPNFIYWPLSIKLQFLSSKIGVAFIDAMNIPVYLDGNIIDLGNYQLQVAEACSGLRYLFPLASFSFLFATLYRGPNWQKVLLFLSSIPITIFTNSARIAIIGYLVNSYGIAQAEGFLHAFEGWVIFVLCIVLLLGLAMALQRLSGKGQFLFDTLDLDMTGLGAKVSRIFRAQYSPRVAAAALFMILITGLSPLLFRHVSNYPQRTTLQQFPMNISGWKGRQEFLSFDVERVLAADDYLQADFKDPIADRHVPVNLLISYYKSQTEGSGIHSPEVCIPAGGWEVSRWEQSTIDIGTNSNLRVNRAIIEKERDQQLVYYWFEQRGHQLTNDYVVKAYTVWDSIMKGRSDGALIRVTTPIADNDIAGAEERLRRFLMLASPRFPEFVPL